MAGPNYTVIPHDWANLEYIISDLSSRILDEDTSFSDYLLKDGSRELTANWDAGPFEIRASTFESDVTTGTAPLAVASTTVVTNLNADLLDGQHGSFYAPVSTGVTAAAALTDEKIVRGDAASLAVQTSGIGIDDSDNVTGMGTLGCGAITSTGVAIIEGIGDGGRTNYDLKVGDTTTPDYGMIQFGNAVIGRTSYKAGNIDLDGSILIQNIGGPVTGQVEFCFAVSTGSSTRFALAKAGVGNATYNSRSMLIAGPAPADTDFVTVGYWQTNNNIFDNLACDTAGAGADLGVQNDLEVEGDIFVDSIKESTSGSGIVFGNDVDINGGTVDAITSLTVANNIDIGNFTITANGLTIDGTFTDGTATITGGDGSGFTSLVVDSLLFNGRTVSGTSEDLQLISGDTGAVRIINANASLSIEDAGAIVTFSPTGFTSTEAGFDWAGVNFTDVGDITLTATETVTSGSGGFVVGDLTITDGSIVDASGNMVITTAGDLLVTASGGDIDLTGAGAPVKMTSIWSTGATKPVGLIAFGVGADASGPVAMAIGPGATATSNGAISIAKNGAATTNDGPIIIGFSEGASSIFESSGEGSINMGFVGASGKVTSSSISSGTGSILIAHTENEMTSSALGDGAVAIGINVQATANGAFVFGSDLTNAVADTIGMGIGAKDFTISATALTWTGTSSFDGAMTTTSSRIISVEAAQATDTLDTGDHYVSCNTTGAPVTINLPALSSANDGTVYIITDGDSNAFANNITISPNASDGIQGGGDDVDLVLSANDDSITLIANNTAGQWEVAA